MTNVNEFKEFLSYVLDGVADLDTVRSYEEVRFIQEEFAESGLLERLYHAQSVLSKILSLPNVRTDAVICEFLFTLGRLFEIRRRQ